MLDEPVVVDDDDKALVIEHDWPFIKYLYQYWGETQFQMQIVVDWIKNI